MSVISVRSSHCYSFRAPQNSAMSLVGKIQTRLHGIKKCVKDLSGYLVFWASFDPEHLPKTSVTATQSSSVRLICFWCQNVSRHLRYRRKGAGFTGSLSLQAERLWRFSGRVRLFPPPPTHAGVKLITTAGLTNHKVFTVFVIQLQRCLHQQWAS